MKHPQLLERSGPGGASVANTTDAQSYSDAFIAEMTAVRSEAGVASKRMLISLRAAASSGLTLRKFLKTCMFNSGK